MCNMDGELMSLEEVGRLMDEQEMNNTMATSASTAISPSTVAITATATTFNIISEASNEKISGAILFKEPNENQQAPSLSKTTPEAKMKRSGVRARQHEAKSAQKLSKISVCITENREAHQSYSMEKIPWTDQPESEFSTYFDDASLARQAVYISFDESEGSSAVPLPVTRMENAANSTPIKPVTPHLSTQQPRRVNSFVPTTPSRDKFTGSSHLSGQLDKSSSVATRIPGGPREVITISFPDIEALSSGLKNLNAAKKASAGGMVVSINGPIGDSQVEVSGPIGSNIRGFVRKTCPRLSEQQIKAAFK
ncbi:hypothetical protein ACHAO8_004727 [Botrytis cinerea]